MTRKEFYDVCDDILIEAGVLTEDQPEKKKVKMALFAVRYKIGSLKGRWFDIIMSEEQAMNIIKSDQYDRYIKIPSTEFETEAEE